MGTKKAIQELRRNIALQRIAAKGFFKSLRLTQMPMTEPIDFVVTWVDGNDPAWRAEKAKYDPAYAKGNSDARYRDWNQFMYWFRAVEKYAPWVRYVHLVTWGHLPPWLNTKHPKLKIVNHRDYIPEKYLPTFSSIPIELNIHRIPDLSEHFVYFNDDMLLAAPVQPKDFFEGGLPKHCAIALPVRNYRYNGPFAHQLFSIVGLVNGYFDVYGSMEQHPELWFHVAYGTEKRYNMNAFADAYLPGMYFSHLGVPLRKSTMCHTWEAFAAELEKSSMQRFRTPLDIMHQIFSLWEIMSGTFVPVASDHYGVKFGALSKELSQIEAAFSGEKYRMICLNDSVDVAEENFLTIKTELDRILENTFPEKSSFEE